MEIELPKSANCIIKTLNAAGFTAYAVGGYVRDCLLGITPSDCDICTNAAPDEVKRLFRKTVDIGFVHGTVTVVCNGKTHEVTTFRRDGSYSDCRRPDHVTFTSELYDDLARRDFTINALCYNDNEGVIDYFSGRDDLAAGIIRTIGDAGERFGEDALRILRAARFAAAFEFAIEDKTLRGMCECAPKLQKISYERIAAELIKIILSDAELGFSYLENTNCLINIDERLCLIDSSCTNACNKLPKIKHLRTAAIFAKCADYADIFRKLTFDNKTIKSASVLIENINADLTEEYKMKKFASRTSPDVLRELLLLKQAFGLPADFEVYNGIDEFVSLKTLAINGSDLINIGIRDGQMIGIALEEILDKVNKGEIKNK